MGNRAVQSSAMGRLLRGGGRRVAMPLVVLALAALGGGLAACTVGSAESQPGTQAVNTETPAPAVPPSVSVADGATGVDPLLPVSVAGIDGPIASVSMVNEEGREITAQLAADRLSWITKEPLGYNRTYTLTATGDNGASQTVTFHTVQPAETTSVALSPLEGSTVGIGQVISFHFGNYIEDRQAAQDAITITTNPPVEGAFYWLNNEELRWRPAQYWTPGTTVTVNAQIYGKDLGAGNYGEDDNATSFTIGDVMTADVDDNTKTMTISHNGEVIKTMPVSLGSDKYPTPNGVYVVGDRYPEIVMDSSTFGVAVDSAEGYRTTVDNATQMSYSGIFVHSAPWSVWAQGSQNTSHGCVNVSPENAQWFIDNFKRGDVITVRNTKGDTLSGYDGLGDWNIPWETWSAGNADEHSAW